MHGSMKSKEMTDRDIVQVKMIFLCYLIQAKAELMKLQKTAMSGKTTLWILPH